MALLGVYDVIGAYEGVVAPPLGKMDTDGIATAKFLLPYKNIVAFSGSDNVTTLRFKSDINDDYFSFDDHEITKVEIKMPFISNQKIDSDGDNVEFDGDRLYVRFGAFTVPHRYPVIIKVFNDENTNGVVICGPELAGSSLFVTLVV